MTYKRPFIPPHTIEAPPPQLRQAVSPKAVVEAAPKEALKFNVKEVVDAESLISHNSESARANFLKLHSRSVRVFDAVESAVECIDGSQSLGEAKKKFFDGQKGKLQTVEVEQAGAIFDTVYERMEKTTHGVFSAEQRPQETGGAKAINLSRVVPISGDRKPEDWAEDWEPPTEDAVDWPKPPRRKDPSGVGKAPPHEGDRAVMSVQEGSAPAARLPGNLPGIQASDAALVRAKQSPEYDVAKVSGVDSLLRRHESLDDRAATLAVDFSRLHLPDGSQLSGAGLHCDETNRDNMVGQVAKLLKEEGRSPQEIARFMEAALSAESLSLINKGRGGMSARHIISHEHNHGIVDSISREDRRLIWDTMGDAERERATDYVSRNWGISPQNTDAIMDEYFTESLTNAGHWEQQGGLTAEAGTLREVRAFASEASSRRRIEATRELIFGLANPETRDKAVLRLTALAREDAQCPTSDGPYNVLLKAQGNPDENIRDGIKEVIDRINNPENYVKAPEAVDEVLEWAKKLQENLARTPDLRDFEANVSKLHKGLFGREFDNGNAKHSFGEKRDFMGLRVSWCQSEKDAGKVSPGVAGKVVDAIADHIGASREEVGCFLLGKDKDFKKAFLEKYGDSERVRGLRDHTPLRMPEHLEPASLQAEPAGRLDDAAVSGERVEPLSAGVRAMASDAGGIVRAPRGVSEGEAVADACSRLLDSPSTAREKFLESNPGRERLFDAVDAAVDCAMGCGSRDEAQKAFLERMRTKGGEPLGHVFDATYDRVMEAQASAVPEDAVMLDSQSIGRMGAFIGEKVKTVASAVGGFVEDISHRLSGGYFSLSSRALERMLHERVIPTMEAQNFAVARDVLEAEGRWGQVYGGVEAKVRERVGAEAFDAMDEPTRDAHMRGDLFDELEGQGFHIRVKDPPAIRWASKRRMGAELGRYYHSDNIIEINRGAYFGASTNPSQMDALQGIIGTGVIGHELYHAEQRAHEIGKVRPNLYDGTIFRWGEATPERRQDLFNLWHSMSEGSAEFASMEPEHTQRLLDVEAKVLGGQPLTRDEAWTAVDVLYSPYTLGELTLAAIREQVTAHYQSQGSTGQQAKAFAEQTVRDYVRQIVPGMERNMVEGLSVSEVAQMTNIRDGMYRDYVTARERMGRPYLTADAIMAAAPDYAYEVLNNEVGLRQAELYHSQSVQDYLQDKIDVQRDQGADVGAFERLLGNIDARVVDSTEQLGHILDQRRDYEQAHNILPTFAPGSDEIILDLDFNPGGQTQR